APSPRQNSSAPSSRKSAGTRPRSTRISAFFVVATFLLSFRSSPSRPTPCEISRRRQCAEGTDEIGAGWAVADGSAVTKTIVALHPFIRLAVMTISSHTMVMKQVRIADLKARLSEYLRAVRRGETIAVLDRDTPVAQIVPIRER